MSENENDFKTSLNPEPNETFEEKVAKIQAMLEGQQTEVENRKDGVEASEGPNLTEIFGNSEKLEEASAVIESESQSETPEIINEEPLVYGANLESQESQEIPEIPEGAIRVASMPVEGSPTSIGVPDPLANLNIPTQPEDQVTYELPDDQSFEGNGFIFSPSENSLEEESSSISSESESESEIPELPAVIINNQPNEKKKKRRVWPILLLLLVIILIGVGIFAATAKNHSQETVASSSSSSSSSSVSSSTSSSQSSQASSSSSSSSMSARQQLINSVNNAGSPVALDPNVTGNEPEFAWGNGFSESYILSKLQPNGKIIPASIVNGVGFWNIYSANGTYVTTINPKTGAYSNH